MKIANYPIEYILEDDMERESEVSAVLQEMLDFFGCESEEELGRMLKEYYLSAGEEE